MGSDSAPLSIRNPRVQHLRRLIGRRRSRSEAGQFAFEGPHLVLEALASDFPLDAVFFDEETVGEHQALLDDVRGSGGIEVHVLRRGVLAQVADTTTPQGVIAIAPLPSVALSTVLAGSPDGLTIVLDAVNDPGNAGTIVRTAEAVGAVAVVFGGTSTDPFGPKTVRASAGSTFRVPLAVASHTGEALDTMRQAGSRRVGTTAATGPDYRDVDLTGDVALVLGSEARGIAAPVEAAVDERVRIPMRGQVESLNVAVAAAVLAYERLRQMDAKHDSDER
jgi:TrmH family RNA methyltransferase